ncbi:5'-nucleotidase C-terminal domain-containing protein [Mongoliitalea daihaiensis]|uniref:5'-nucleotidase C-terminal domain-containing protein n=1 Tax=Mongoliitalea daihaiensis TaxID=2782006 RepID=UPI001F2FA305|nr:5'-nucleotidase C-terminal domain-containing protein [Mongoliitalea daihaiensis]UJP64983.1 5'-nucleotidase C-terminal domain-containing protein [Mongoliitalea daihaiensis]
MRSTKLLLKPIPALFLGSILVACSPNLTPSGTGQFIGISETVEVKEEIQAFLEPFKISLEAEMNAVIGFSEEELNKSGVGESTLGNLITDYQKSYTEELLGHSIDISIMNNGGIRNVLPKGEITLGAIYEISPFDNYLHILEIDAAGIIELIKYASRGRNVGMAGLTYKTVDGEIEEIRIGGKELSTEQRYRLAANDYIANGGDNMTFLVSLNRIEETSIVLRDILIDRIKKETAQGNTIKAKIEGRQLIQ